MAKTEDGLTIRDQRTEKRFFVDNYFVDEYGPLVGPYGHAVYNVLIRHSRPDGRGAWPSHATIAKKAGCGPAKVKDVLKQFEDLGLIAVRARFNRETGAQTSNEYIILDPPALADPPVVADTPPGYPAETPPPVSEEATNNPPSEQSSVINPPKKSALEKPDILDAMLRFSGIPAESWTVPAAAGGADDWAVAVDAFAALAALDPATVPKTTRKEWARVLREIGEEWGAGPGEVAEAVRVVPDSEFHWKTYASPHSARADLGVLIGQRRNGGVRKAKKGKGNDTLAQIDAFREKLRAARERAPTVEAEYVVVGEAL